MGQSRYVWGGTKEIAGWGKAVLAKPWPAVCNPTERSPPGSSVHKIIQAEVLEGMATPSFRGSSQLNPGLQHCRQIPYHLGQQGSLTGWVPGVKRGLTTQVQGQRRPLTPCVYLGVSLNPQTLVSKATGKSMQKWHQAMLVSYYKIRKYFFCN